MNQQIPISPARTPPRSACLGGCLLLFMPFALGVIVLVIFLAENDPDTTPPTVQGLLQSLSQRVTDDELAVTLELAVPVAGVHVFTLDASTLDTMQDEYLCLSQTIDDAPVNVCIPYGNIAGITYPAP